MVPWYSNEINDAKRSRRKAERKWRKTRLPVDFADFKRKRNKVTNFMNKTREEFYSKFIEDNGTDQRKLFCAAKKLLGASDVLNFPVHLDKTVLANDVRNFFVRKVEHIGQDTDSSCLSSADRNLVPPDGEASDITDEVLRSCGNLSERNVCELIRASAKKSCLLDPFPTNVVCDSLNVLLPVITNMVNASLFTGHFPDNWKEAIINPLFKKGAIDFAYKNLRPVNNLQFVSKITERAVFDQLYAHIMKNELFPELQSTYRKPNSTETALVKIVNDMNRQHASLIVLLDLSAAFDTVGHTILLRRLETSFGVTRDALKWIASYLSARSQRVMINGVLSDRFDLSFEVPQGSCLGQLLFSAYASKLFQVIKNHLHNTHAYADDTQLYLSFKSDSSMGETEARGAMERCIRAVRHG